MSRGSLSREVVIAMMREEMDGLLMSPASMASTVTVLPVLAYRAACMTFVSLLRISHSGVVVAGN